VFRKLSIWEYLDKLASDKPVPGGGSTSALVASLSAALGIMVARIVSKRAKSATLRKIKSHEIRLGQLQKQFEKTIDTDPAVYAALMRTYKVTRKLKNRDQAKKKIDAALEKSFRVQWELAREISEARKIIEGIGRLATGSIANDLKVSLALLRGAWLGAFHTAKINVDYVHNPVLKKSLMKKLKTTPKA